MASPEVTAQQDGTGPLMRQLVLTYLREEGVASVRAGHRERAAQYLRQALTLDGENAELWTLLGTVVDDRLRAACTRQAQALNPGHPRPAPLLEYPLVDTSPSSFRLPTSRLYLTGRPAALPREPRPARVKPKVRVIRPLRWPITLPPLRLSRRFQVRLVAVMVLFLVVVLDLVLVGAFLRRYEGCIFPGIQIAGLGVGGLTPEEAGQILQREVAPFLERRILLQGGGRTWAFSAAEAGLRYRVDYATQEAYELGRQERTLAAWTERVRIGLWGEELPLLAELRASRVQFVLEQLATLERPAVPPAVSWEEGWVISAGQDGRHFFREETEKRLTGALTAVVNGDVPRNSAALLIPVPLVTVTAALPEEQLTSLRGQLDRVGRPLVVQCADHSWELTEADISPWLQVDLPLPPGAPSVQVNAGAIRSYLRGLAFQVDLPAQLARMELVEGRVVAFDPGQDGRRLDLDTATADLAEVLRMRLDGENVDEVELSTVVVSANTDALMTELGLIEFVGGGRSSFTGSPANRVTNIVVGGRELHGRLVAPDEIFSLNAALSPITWEKGYVLSEVIVGGDVDIGMGGGLCQVATTLYRAALNSGLEIVERYPHMWRLSWYEDDSPPGFDATIMLGGPDLKFRNNTGHYLLIQVETSPEESWQAVHFYGTSPDWEVVISDPVISNGGHDVSFVRTVSKYGVVLSEETFYSHYY